MDLRPRELDSPHLLSLLTSHQAQTVQRPHQEMGTEEEYSTRGDGGDDSQAEGT
jgi:hypothetical protein